MMTFFLNTHDCFNPNVLKSSFIIKADYKMSADPCPQSHLYFIFFNIIQAALVLNKSLEKNLVWILFPEMTPGDKPGLFAM